MNQSNLSPYVDLELLCGEGNHRVSLTANIVMALAEVANTSSLNAATKRLHMGYSNTYYAIIKAEDALGVQLLSRDSTKGFGLTAEGRWLVDLFESMQSQTQEYAHTLVEQACMQRNDTAFSNIEIRQTRSKKANETVCDGE